MLLIQSGRVLDLWVSPDACRTFRTHHYPGLPTVTLSRYYGKHVPVYQYSISTVAGYRVFYHGLDTWLSSRHAAEGVALRGAHPPTAAGCGYAAIRQARRLPPVHMVAFLHQLFLVLKTQGKFLPPH